MKTYDVEIMWGTLEVYRVEAESEVEARGKWTDYASVLIRTVEAAEEVIGVKEVSE